MYVREVLSSLTGYPIPESALRRIGMEARIDVDDYVANASVRGLNYAKALVYMYVATAPNISEGGVSITLSATDKSVLLGRARRFAALAGVDDLVPGASFGYKGDSL